jgi:hypothetical protein
MATHICGQCGLKTQIEQEYLDHKCSATGFAPTQPEHLGEEFAAVSTEAVKRGEERKKELKFNVNKNKVSVDKTSPDVKKTEEVKPASPQVEPEAVMDNSPFSDLPETEEKAAIEL